MFGFASGTGGERKPKLTPAEERERKLKLTPAEERERVRKMLEDQQKALLLLLDVHVDVHVRQRPVA